MGFLQGLLACLGRVMIATIFLVSAAGNKIWKFNEVAGYMAAEGVPQLPVLGLPLHKVLLAGAIVFLLLGGLSVAAGYKARVGGFLLLVFLGAATYYFHDFWNAEPEERPLEMIQFLKNMSLAGTMLFIIANGAGPGSLDRRQRRPISPDRGAGQPQQADTGPIEVGDEVVATADLP
jgi:putative oxidoreductase